MLHSALNHCGIQNAPARPSVTLAGICAAYSERGSSRPADAGEVSENGESNGDAEEAAQIESSADRDILQHESLFQEEQVIVEFTWSDFGNFIPLNESVSYYQIIGRPSEAQFLHGRLPAFTHGAGLFYTVAYRTNLDSSQRVIASNVPAGRPFEFSSPDLMPDEVITEISIKFDSVPAGFGVGDTIAYSFVVLDEDNVSIRWEVAFGETSRRDFLIASISNDIDRFSGLENMYDAESWANFQYVISTVQVILANPNATIEEIEMAYALLQQAISALNPAPPPSPFTFGNILSTVAIFMLVIVAAFVVVKLLRYKKRITPGLSLKGKLHA